MTPNTYRLQPQITRHTKNQEKLNLIEKPQAIDADTNIIHVLELPNKDFKRVIIKVLTEVMVHFAQMKNEKNLSEEIENTKKNEMEILELKSTINKRKISVDEVNSRVDETEEEN